jgi:uncharacterized protein DUF4157
MRVLAHNPKAPQPPRRAKPTLFARARSGQSHDVSSLLHFQRSADGQAPVHRSTQVDATQVAARPATTLTRFRTDFSRIPVHSAALRSPQPTLSINKPGDRYEREADRITDQVMGMAAPQLQRGQMHHDDAVRHRHLHRTALARTVTPVIPPTASEQTTASKPITSQIASTRGGGSPLPESSRSFMESCFGTDFSQVRLHTGDYAARLSGALGAKAFTVGNDIYFRTGSLSPDSSHGRRLLAHELTHTVQQRAVPSGHLCAPAVIQKTDGDKAKTHFGEFEAVKYHAIKQKADGKEVGVEMFLKFNPGANVDAKQIALTQAATGKIAGTSAATAEPNFGRRSASSGAGQGHFIDVLAGFPSPLYSTADQPRLGATASDLTSYPTVPSAALSPAQVTAQETATGLTGVTRTGFGKHGFRFMDAGKLKGPDSAELYDAPQLGTANDSEQTFESAALAIEGTQQGSYYGSVSWGWRRDTTGKFAMVPFRAISQGTPSVNFLTAASIWNTATEDFNWGVNAASASIWDPTHLSTKKATVARGTALTWGGAQGTAGGVTYSLVTVKDGPSKGTAGAIKSTDMAIMDVGRPTVDLPVPEVYATNVAGGWMVTNPAQAATSVISKLPKGTRVAIMPDVVVKIVAAALGATVDPAWAFVQILDGPDIEKRGWVQKSLLTREALGTR